MDNESLGRIISNRTARAVIYAAWVLSGIAIGAAQVGFVDPDPQWLVVTHDVWSYLGLFIGSLAAVNSNIIPTTRTVVVDKDTSALIE